MESIPNIEFEIVTLGQIESSLQEGMSFDARNFKITKYPV